MSKQGPGATVRILEVGELVHVYLGDELIRALEQGTLSAERCEDRLFIAELRVNSHAKILPTYRLVTPAVCAMSEKVGAAGIEPATSPV